MKICLPQPIIKLDGSTEEVEGKFDQNGKRKIATCGHYLAELFAYRSPTNMNPIRAYTWAQQLYENDTIEVDDVELKDIISWLREDAERKLNGVAAIYRAQILQQISKPENVLKEEMKPELMTV